MRPHHFLLVTDKKLTLGSRFLWNFKCLPEQSLSHPSTGSQPAIPGSAPFQACMVRASGLGAWKAAHPRQSFSKEGDVCACMNACVCARLSLCVCACTPSLVHTSVLCWKGCFLTPLKGSLQRPLVLITRWSLGVRLRNCLLPRAGRGMLINVQHGTYYNQRLPPPGVNCPRIMFIHKQVPFIKGPFLCKLKASDVLVQPALLLPVRRGWGIPIHSLLLVSSCYLQTRL